MDKLKLIRENADQFKKHIQDIENLENQKKEQNILKELKSFSSTIITREGMNLRCAEKLLDRAKYDLADIEEAKKYVKIEKFIDTEKIEVLIIM